MLAVGDVPLYIAGAFGVGLAIGFVFGAAFGVREEQDANARRHRRPQVESR